MSTYGLVDTLRTPKYRDHDITMEQVIESDLAYVVWCLDQGVFELDNEAYEFFSEECERNGVP